MLVAERGNFIYVNRIVQQDPDFASTTYIPDGKKESLILVERVADDLPSLVLCPAARETVQVVSRKGQQRTFTQARHNFLVLSSKITSSKGPSI